MNILFGKASKGNLTYSDKFKYISLKGDLMDRNIQRRDNCSYQEIKRLALFFIVGGVNTLFGYSLYALLLYLDLHYALASLLSTIGGILFNFKTTGVIVFKNNDNRLLFRFIAVYAFNYLWGIGALTVFSVCNVNMYLAGAILIMPGALIAYVLQKKFVFRRDKGETNKHNYSLLQRGR